jgi:hypothetical protein
MCSAFYVLFRAFHAKKRLKPKDYNMSYDEEAIFDELITKLLEKNHAQENEEKILQSKADILENLIELHKTGSFCNQLSEQEIIDFVKNKLNMEIKKNG